MTARRVIALLLGALFIAAAVVVALNVRDEGEGLDSPVADSIATRTPADLIARGEYLARAGDCIACHTARGGVPYAGGRGIETPFGTVYAPNLTPDSQTGLGQWSASDFWRALHNGRSRDGRLLYPAFPYTAFAKTTDEDLTAIYAYLMSVPPVRQPNRPHELRTHIKGALTNGVTKDEIREIFMQVAIYAGVPAGVDSFRIAREVFAEIDKG